MIFPKCWMVTLMEPSKPSWHWTKRSSLQSSSVHKAAPGLWCIHSYYVIVLPLTVRSQNLTKLIETIVVCPHL